MICPVGLRGSWKWTLGLFMAAGFLEAAFFGQLASFIPLQLPRLGVAQADVPLRTGQMYALAGAIGIPFLPLWGALADRFARRPLIARSFLVHVVACAVMAIAPSAPVFIAGYAITALAFGNTGLMTATLAERTPAGRTAFAITTMNAAGPVGAFIGPIYGGPVFDAFGLTPLVVANAVAMLAVAAVMAFGYEDPYRGRSTRPILVMALDGVALLARSPRLRILFPALFILVSGWMAAFAFMPLAVARLYDGPFVGTAVGVVSGAAGLAALALGPFIGALADRWGQWRVLYAVSIVTAVLFPVAALARDLVAFGVLWTVVTGIRSAAFGLSFAVLSASVATAQRGRVMSFSFLPVNLGFAVGPLLAGPLARSDVFLVFVLAGALSVPGILVLAWAQRQPVPEADTVAAT